MLIIGLDPGLGCTGWGVIAAEGNRLDMSPTARSAPTPGRACRRGWSASRRKARPRPRAAPPGRRRGRGGVPQRQPPVDAEARPGARRRPARRRPPRPRGRRICAAPGQEGGGRRRRRRQVPGPRHDPALLPGVKAAGADAADALAVAITHAHHLASRRAIGNAVIAKLRACSTASAPISRSSTSPVSAISSRPRPAPCPSSARSATRSCCTPRCWSARTRSAWSASRPRSSATGSGC